MSAVGDDIADDTAVIRAALGAVKAGGVVSFPVGNYRVSGPLEVTRPVTLSGEDFGSQIYQSSEGYTLFHLRNVNGAIIRDLNPGFIATAFGTSLVKLTNSHQSPG